MHLAINVVKFLRHHQIKWWLISTWIGPRSLHDLACQRVVSFHHDLVENSARQRDEVAKNIPKTSTNHPKYITPGKMLPSTLATGAVSARQGICWCGNTWSLCLLLPSAVFNSNEQHIKKHMLTSHHCPEMPRDVWSRTDPMFEALEQMPSNVCLDQLPKLIL